MIDSKPDSDIYFAAVGDVHGHIYKMWSLLKRWEEKHHKRLSFVLQVGDFEPHRKCDSFSRNLEIGRMTSFGTSN